MVSRTRVYSKTERAKVSAAVDTRDLTSTSMLAGAGASPMGPAQDMVKPFKAEVENLALSEGLYKWSCEGVEDRVLARWGKRV